MPPLGAKERAQLPDRAFAYVDSRGRRRLPIHDAAHVRNALARFGQVAFEDDAARDRARTRLLRAAKKHGIVPIGFIDAELRPQRRLPTGLITFLMSDIEGSTELVRRLGKEYPSMLMRTRRLLRATVRDAGGREVDTRADEFFAVFPVASGAVAAAVTAQRRMEAETWPSGLDVRLRIGLHLGRPALTDAGYVGVAVHAGARVCAAGHGGQIVTSRAVRAAVAKRAGAEVVSFRSLGRWRLQGLPKPEELFQVETPDLPSSFPPPRNVRPVI
jgi:class 3 adenylate cyclase